MITLSKYYDEPFSQYSRKRKKSPAKSSQKKVSEKVEVIYMAARIEHGKNFEQGLIPLPSRSRPMKRRKS